MATRRQQEQTVNEGMKESKVIGPDDGVKYGHVVSDGTRSKWGPLVRCDYCYRWYRGPDVPAHGPPGYEARPCGFQPELPGTSDSELGG